MEHQGRSRRDIDCTLVLGRELIQRLDAYRESISQPGIPVSRSAAARTILLRFLGGEVSR